MPDAMPANAITIIPIGIRNVGEVNFRVSLVEAHLCKRSVPPHDPIVPRDGRYHQRKSRRNDLAIRLNAASASRIGSLDLQLLSKAGLANVVTPQQYLNK